jgi:DNA-binding response OmpR family regulator
MKLLIALFNYPVAHFIQRALASHGHEADVASLLWNISKHCSSYKYDVVLLDVMLLHSDHTLLCLPDVLQRTGTLLVTLTSLPRNRGGWVARAMGAKAYIAMPFSLSVLICRLEEVVEQCSPWTTRLGIRDLTLDPAHQHAWRGSVRIPINGAEFALLKLLADRAGRRVNHTTLAKSVFGDAFPGPASNVTTLVERLCDKVNRGSTLIHKVQGGYRFGKKGDRLTGPAP